MHACMIGIHLLDTIAYFLNACNVQGTSPIRYGGLQSYVNGLHHTLEVFTSKLLQVINPYKL